MPSLQSPGHPDPLSERLPHELCLKRGSLTVSAPEIHVGTSTREPITPPSIGTSEALKSPSQEQWTRLIPSLMECTIPWRGRPRALARSFVENTLSLFERGELGSNLNLKGRKALARD